MLVKIINTFGMYRQGSLYNIDEEQAIGLVNGGFAEKIIDTDPPIQPGEPVKQQTKTRKKNVETAALDGGENAAEIA